MSTDAIQMCCDVQPFLRIIKLIISLIQWTVPLVLIVLGTVDMFKAVASGDEKVIKDVQSTFIKRLIYGAAIFLVPFFVRLILNFVNNNLIYDNSGLVDSSSWIDCWNGEVVCNE